MVQADAHIQPFRYFVVPSLKELRVNAESRGEHSQDTLFLDTLLNAVKTIARQCVWMTSVEILWTGGPFVPVPHSVLDLLAPLVHLQSLFIGTNLFVSRQALYTLSTLPSLRHLQIQHLEFTHVDGIDLAALNAGFPTLQTFWIDGPCSVVRYFLAAMPRCSVRHCTLTVHDMAPEDFQRKIVERVVRKFGASLSTLELRFPSGNLASQHGMIYVRFAVDLLPLLCGLRTLTEVRLGTLEPSELTDALCGHMATAWPYLRVMHFGSSRSVDNPPASMVTLHGLRHFAERCPGLEDIIIQVNASGSHWAAEAKNFALGRRTARSVHLDLTTSLVTTPQAVAAYLRQCFHAFSDLRFDKKRAEECGQGARVEAWKALCRLLLWGDALKEALRRLGEE
ncbi:hypothetical protein TRAPUB_884 [Trametes pubescens]|uniref:F-box domain-containing protein n=1 Tax=Trametes pubescens TaxID=154538 RepID=A0A1M2VKZ0_TRAPU|nr:hypothetical protein TRAPUB_884 [Trametes pubescens]